MAILRRTEKAMMRAMCKVKVIENRTSKELMSLLSLKNTLDGLAGRVEYDDMDMFCEGIMVMF